MAPIPVIDLFAGPGGLGEGFSAYGWVGGQRCFKILLSVEMDIAAHATLELRSFFRQFPRGSAPDAYYEHLRGAIRREVLFGKYPLQAQAASRETLRAELCEGSHWQISGCIGAALRGADPDRWVLIGGPPCQAYSLAGRARNRGESGYVPERDARQTLYRQYLRVIADHWPAAFIMENVKGLLSAQLDGRGIFERILADLRSPLAVVPRNGRHADGPRRERGYRIYSLVEHGSVGEPDARIFVVRAEKYGVPQARHRVILLGVRDDIAGRPELLQPVHEIAAWQVLHGLPPLRSGLSRQPDTPALWRGAIREMIGGPLIGEVEAAAGHSVANCLRQTVQKLRGSPAGRGAEYIRCNPDVRYEPGWYLDGRLGGVCNHATRGHMCRDLHRYLFAACYAQQTGRSPDLGSFPRSLLPEHANVRRALDGGLFTDRFRAQLAHRPSTTITSHIAKDGHHYIHPDPMQCRSLTVREAARLQTFPDNYLFCGPKTAQYVQVGNAVPPLLAKQIAGVVFNLLGG